MIGKHETRSIVRKLFSWWPEHRSQDLAELLSLSPEERLAAEEAALAATKWDEKPGYGLIWLVALTFFAVLGTNGAEPLYWLGSALLSLATTLLVHRRFAWRQQSLVNILSSAIDKRLVLSLLACRPRMDKRSGVASRGYRAIIAALERLLPMVDEQDCMAWRHGYRQALLHFLESTPVHAAITILVLGLAPAIGDSRTLGYVALLAEQHEWGGAVAPNMCRRLHQAACACEAALRESLARRKTSAQLLRAYENPPVQISTELLRAASGSGLPESKELLRAGSPAVIVEQSSNSPLQDGTVARSNLLLHAPQDTDQQPERVIAIRDAAV
jgi:hypothetical protein